MKIPLLEWKSFPVRFLLWIALIIFLVWWGFNEWEKYKARRDRYQPQPMQNESVTRFWRDD
jgi:hypothetical protein